MQKLLSLREFKEYCDELSEDHEFIFDTENQMWYEIGDSMKVTLSFKEISFSFNPNVIMLKSDAGIIAMLCVKRIVRRSRSLLGDVFDVVCNDPYCDDCEKYYTIISTITYDA